jgi:membrane protease YdiL (CAAX protease family)
MQRQTPHGGSAWHYFLLVTLLSIPFWLVGPIAERVLRWEIPVNLPISALQAISPLLAALLLVGREKGWVGVRELLASIGDVERIKHPRWLIPVFTLMPLIYLLVFFLMQLTGASLPTNPQFPITFLPVSFLLFFVAAACEEVGWSGYALERMPRRLSALAAALIVGVLWALLHIIPDVQAGHTFSWIAWQRLYSILLRVLLVWIYLNTSSLFAAIVFHALDNTSFSMFPNYGSHYDPFYICLITAIVVVGVVAVWGPATLARNRFAT